MKTIDQLIQELCPDGVEYKKLGEVSILYTGKQLNKNNMEGDGLYPVINGGINPSGFTNEFNETENTITISQGGASAGFVNWLSTKFYAGGHCYVLKPKGEIENRFLYHFIKNKQKELIESQYGAGIPALNRSSINSLEIPVPSIEVQEKIVEVLDTFTSLISELKDELQARKQQYEYYRNQLLSFNGNVDVEYKKLGEVCDFVIGGDVPKERFSKVLTSEYSIPIFSNGVGDSALYGYTNIPRVIHKCVTISARGTIGYSELRTQSFYPIIRLVCAIPKKGKLFAEYLLHSLRTVSFKVPKVGIPQLTIPIVKEVLIPVPPLPEQQRIVDILDKFEELVNDKEHGLPAEIEARQKQYEYYRNRLLTFKRK